MRSIEQHLSAALAMAAPLPTEWIPLLVVDPGRALADDVHAKLPVPPFDNSAMDGYAVRAADLTQAGQSLEVVGDIPAGHHPAVPIEPGQAVRIMTGAPIPPGADSVVPVEATDQPAGETPLPKRVQIREAPKPGQHIRRLAEDVKHGALVAKAGSPVTATLVAAAASTGHNELLVNRLPRVVVIATGDELVSPGKTPRSGELPDSNSVLLTWLAQSWGAEVSRFRIGDHPNVFRELLETLDADLVVSTGGVSAGVYEVVRQATAGELDFHKVAMQPGKPQGIGQLHGPNGEIPMLAFPGNPVSVFVSAWLFLRPMIAKLTGQNYEADWRPAPALEAWKKPAGRTQFLPVFHDRDGIRPAHSLGSGSHAIGSLHLANALARVPADQTFVAVGDDVDVLGVS